MGCTLTSRPLEGLPRNKITFRNNNAQRNKIENRNERNRHLRINKKGIITDRTRVSASPVQGNPSNQARVPEGRANRNPREKTPKVILKNKPELFGLSLLFLDKVGVYILVSVKGWKFIFHCQTYGLIGLNKKFRKDNLAYLENNIFLPAL